MATDIDHFSVLSKETGLPLEICELLGQRGFSNGMELDFFKHRIFAFSKDPFLIEGMKESVELLREMILSKKKILLFSDSDIDGLSSLIVFRKLFDKLGVDYIYDFPRGSETFGLTDRTIESAVKEKVSLIVTLDCGVRDNEVIASAVSKGVNVIVCDHHDPSPELPRAAIVNPKLKNSQYPDTSVSGCGVAFLFALSYLYSLLPVYSKDVALVNGRELHIFNNMILLQIIMDFSQDDIKDRIVIVKDNSGADENIKYTRFASMYRSAVENSYYENDLAGNDIFENYTEFAFIFSSLFSSKKIAQFANELIPYVAIGTVADVVPLKRTNRSLVYLGLNGIEKSSDPVIVKLREMCRKNVNTKEISWTIAPFLNSPGRYGKADLAAQFLYGEYFEQPYLLIKEINRGRKDQTKKAMEGIDEHIISGCSNIAAVLSPELNEGLTGIIAARLSDKYSIPAVVATMISNDVIKGSARAPDGFDVLSCAENFSSMFLRFGGHPQAFGFSIDKTKFSNFISDFDKSILNIEKTDVPKYDLELDINRVNSGFYGFLKMLEPFGKDNPEPIFISRRVPLLTLTAFGGDSSHGKFVAGINRVEIIGWNMIDEMREMFLSGFSDIIYHIDENDFNGRKSIRLIIDSLQECS